MDPPFFNRKFKFCLMTADLNILVLIKEIFCSANNYVKLIFTLKMRAALLRIKKCQLHVVPSSDFNFLFPVVSEKQQEKVLITVLRTDGRDHGF